MNPDHRPLHYLVSTAGIPNLGDELIAATWLKHLAERHPEADVVLDCIDPAASLAPLAGLHPRLRLTSTLWQICFRNWAAGARTREIAREVIADPSLAGDLAAGVELLRRADVVHLTGGGFLNGIWPAFAGLLSGITAATGISGGTAAATGLGLYPAIGGTGEILSELTAGFDVLDVRDEPSSRLLGRPVARSCDDVFLLPDAWLAEPGADLPEVMVSIQSTQPPVTLFPPPSARTPGTARGEAEPDERELRVREARSEQGMRMLIDFAAKTLAAWGADEVGLIECWPDADRRAWEMADDLAPSVRRYPLRDVLHEGFPAAPGQTWLSTRFHPHLFAAAAGASGVAVNLMKGYYDTKHGSLIEQGSGWSLAHYRPFDRRQEIPDRPRSGGYPPGVLAELQGRKRSVAESIYGASRAGRP
ncbi:polysaccharide pyruvyl transferase family protein [Spirillospora sp. NPDC046719]